MNKLFSFAILAACIAVNVQAAPAAPVVKNAMFINGQLGVCVYDKNADLSWTAEFQMKDSGADDSAYAPLGSNTLGSMSQFDKNSYGGRSFFYSTNFTGTADVRVRFTSGEETGAWTEVKNLSAYVAATGTRIGTTTQFTSAVDGKWSTMVDESTNPWLGYDYGEAIRVSRFRVYFRPDLPGRANGAQLQYASDKSFSDAVTFKTVANAEVGSRPIEHVFDVPVSARCWRIVSGTSSGARSSVCEFEIVPVDVPYKPTVAVARDDVTNFYPVVTWSVPMELAATKLAVERATAVAGPYASVAEITDLATYACHTDTTAKVGLPYYYRVSADCNHPSFAGQTATSTVVDYRRWRRLDRAWSDQTKLLGTCTVLPPTNGTAVVAAKAFDGNAGTWPDNASAACTDGPAGLNFGEKAWVAAFGYVCRNDNNCYSRIMNTQLFSSSGDDVEQLDKVVRSDYVAQASQSTKFYWQNTTSVPDDGANCWFLYATRHLYRNTGESFCLNVAELAFFGWTQQDVVDAGVLVPAGNLSVSRRADGNGVDVSWSAGANLASYRLERRTRGADAWTVVADAIDKAATSCSDHYDGVEQKQNTWEYRLVSVGTDETEAASAVTAYVYYVAGDGTGLSGALYAPYRAGWAAACQPSFVADLADGAVNLDVPDGTELVAGSGVTGNARLLWRGTLVAPVDGTYSITLATSDGGAVHVDGTSVCNGWTGCAKTQNGQIVLTAGEHPIEVDARLQNTYNGRRTCVLSWGGPVPDEVIPASQLKPAAAPARLECDGWNVRQYNGARLGRADVIDGGYSIYAPQEAPSSRNAFNATALTRTWRNSFDVSARMQSVQNGRAGIFARSADGDMFCVYFRYPCGTASYIGAYAVTNGSDAISRPFGSELAMDGGESNLAGDVRLKYDGAEKKFYAYWKDDVPTGTNPTEWALLGTFSADGLMDGEYEYGFFVTGETANYRSAFTVKPLVVKTYRAGFTLIVR